MNLAAWILRLVENIWSAGIPGSAGNSGTPEILDGPRTQGRRTQANESSSYDARLSVHGGGRAADTTPNSPVQAQMYLRRAGGVPYVTQYCFRAVNRPSFWPDCDREGTEIGPPAGRADFGVFPGPVRPKSGPECRFTARKHYSKHTVHTSTHPTPPLKPITR